MVSTRWWVYVLFCTFVAFMSFTAAETPLPVRNADPAHLPSGKLVHYEGNPLLRNGPEPYDYGKTGPRVVLKMGPGDYRIWYEAVAADGLTTVGYATSSDGLKWAKKGVVLSPSEPWEKEEISPNSILLEDGIYKLWYHGGGYIRERRRLGNGRIGYATSKDGLSWVKYQGNPVLDIGPANAFDSVQAAEPRVFHLPDGYRMYYTGQDGSQTSLGMATSPDGVHWTKYAGNPILDKKAWRGFWGGAFFLENGIWHLWHGAVASADSQSTSPHAAIGTSLRYMWSTDGITWKDGPDNPVLVQNPDPKAPEYGRIGDSVSGYRDGETYRIMFSGANSNLFGKLGRFNGICLATIRASKK